MQGRQLSATYTHLATKLRDLDVAKLREAEVKAQIKALADDAEHRKWVPALAGALAGGAALIHAPDPSKPLQRVCVPWPSLRPPLRA